MRIDPIFKQAAVVLALVALSLVASAEPLPVGTAAAPAAAASAAAALTNTDQAFANQTSQFLDALWKADPELAIGFGKFTSANDLTIPDPASRRKLSRFAQSWLVKLAAVDAAKLSVAQRTDLALIQNFLNETVWQLSTLREFEWNPSLYTIAGEIDSVINTDYADKSVRIRTVIQRLQHAPAYYLAARHSIVRPTKEHTALAIAQAPGTLLVLDQVASLAQDAGLSKLEQTLLSQRLAAARTASQGYQDWLIALAKKQNASNTRSFRIGATLYQAKFGFDIQSDASAEQMLQRALQAKEVKLTEMDQLSDELWPKYMADQPKPQDRLEKIRLMIDHLSANHTTADKLLTDIRAQIPVLENWVNSHDLVSMDPSKPLVIRATPVYQRGLSVASLDSPQPFEPGRNAYYNVTPIDDKTPEQQESMLREYNHWVLQIISIHEAVPGHYVQLLHANRSPSLIKSLFGNGAMIEGWAVYSERLMLESGYGDNAPEMWLMYDKWNLRSVCNTILDYSVHVLGMTEPQAMHLLTKEAFQSQAEAAGKWRRVQLSSVQLDSYFSGYSEIMALREERKTALGDKFDLKAFNEELLSYGSAPVRMIQRLMTEPKL